MSRHPRAGERTCGACGKRPADRYLFTVLIRTGGHDATRCTNYVCEACAQAGVAWAERFGLVVERINDGRAWDCLVVLLDVDGDAGGSP